MTLDIASNFLCSVIFGLQMHGQHEGPLALLLGLVTQIYELLVSHKFVYFLKVWGNTGVEHLKHIYSVYNL